MLIFGLSARSRHACLREQFYESRLDRKRAGMQLSLISDADAEKSGGPRYESGRPRAIGIGSSISGSCAPNRRSCRRRRSSSCTESSRDRRPGLGGQIPGRPRCDLILGLQILVRGYRLRQNPRRGNRVPKHDRGSHLRPSSPRGRLQTRRHHEPTLHGWGALERRQAAQPQQSSIFYPSCCNGESSRLLCSPASARPFPNLCCSSCSSPSRLV